MAGAHYRLFEEPGLEVRLRVPDSRFAMRGGRGALGRWWRTSLHNANENTRADNCDVEVGEASATRGNDVHANDVDAAFSCSRTAVEPSTPPTRSAARASSHGAKPSRSWSGRCWRHAGCDAGTTPPKASAGCATAAGAGGDRLTKVRLQYRQKRPNEYQRNDRNRRTATHRKKAEGESRLRGSVALARLIRARRWSCHWRKLRRPTIGERHTSGRGWRSETVTHRVVLPKKKSPAHVTDGEQAAESARPLAVNFPKESAFTWAEGDGQHWALRSSWRGGAPVFTGTETTARARQVSPHQPQPSVMLFDGGLEQ